MSLAKKTLLSFLICTSLALSTHASVPSDDEDYTSVGSSKPLIAQSSAPPLVIQAPPLMVQDIPKTSDLSSSQMADVKDLKLKDIDEIREYFKKGFLEITPETYSDLTNCAAPYKKAFKAYDKGLSLKGWNEQNDLKGLSKLLSYFNAVKEIKCRKNIWQEKTIINTLGNAIQYYEKLEAFDLKDMNLNDKAVLKLLKALPNSASLKTLNIQTSTLTSQAQSEIKKKYPNIAEFVVGTETPIAKAEITIEKVDEQKAPSLKPLYRPSAEEQMPVVKKATPQANDPNNNAAKKTTVSAPAQSMRELMRDDIDEALKKVKAKTLSWADFATFISSDPTLTILNLSDNQIGDAGATALAPILKGMTALTKLYLGDNKIGAEGATMLAPFLEGVTALTTLSLSNNQIGDAGATALAPNLKGMTTLTSLNLSNNQIGAEGATVLAPSLKGMTALTYLDLSNNEIGDAGITALAPSLKGMTTLTYLALSNNEIGDAGITALAPSLKGMTALTSLLLYNNQIGDVGATALAPNLKGMTALTSLNLAINQIGDKGATVLAPFLEGMTALTKLYLSSNQIRDKGATVLASSLKGMTALTTLWLYIDQIGDAGKKALEDLKCSRPSLDLKY